MVLNNIISVLDKNKKFNIIKIDLFRNKSIFSFNFKSFIYLFKRNFTAKKYRIIYSDPIISIIILIFFNKIISLRYSQGDDLNLYKTNHFLPNFINNLIKLSLIKNKSFTVVNSAYTKKINVSQNQKVKGILYPYIEIPEGINKPLIISIQAHRNQKNLSGFIEIFKKYKNEYNFLVISQNIIEVPNGMGFLSPNNRSILFFILKHAYAHVSTSKIESFGLPIYESMMLNVPSIVFPNKSFHINENVNELLYVKDNSLESFKKILDDLQSEKFRKQIINKQKVIVNKYSKIKFEKSINNLFESFFEMGFDKKHWDFDERQKSLN